MNQKKENVDQVLDKKKKEVKGLVKEHFGSTPKGENVQKIILKNGNGCEVAIITYGGRIISLKVPDDKGHLENVVLGFDALDPYTSENPFFGALIGRYANRIANGKFSLEGSQYDLVKNNGENHLHGGEKGFDNVIWKIEEHLNSPSTLKLSYLSKDMEEGYPGNLHVFVTYRLTDKNSLEVTYEAETDKTTIVNLTQHSYFNLSGDFDNSILDHEVRINADKFLSIDETSIPTGEFRSVDGTPFDFREPKKIGEDIDKENLQLKRGNGYDHNWVLNDGDKEQRFAASAYHSESGRMLEVFTTEPGLQLYTGNFLDGSLPQGGGEGFFERRTGFCLETQHYPDSPNNDEYPSVVLEPGDKYYSKTTFNFSVKN